jgi:hypothetical protein
VEQVVLHGPLGDRDAAGSAAPVVQSRLHGPVRQAVVRAGFRIVADCEATGRAVDGLPVENFIVMPSTTYFQVDPVTDDSGNPAELAMLNSWYLQRELAVAK